MHPLFERTALEYIHSRKTLEAGAEGVGGSFFLFALCRVPVVLQDDAPSRSLYSSLASSGAEGILPACIA